ncbi:hypothetical protein Bbelb_020970 [Branchiostoma belcheri]|nr:hypothetical protein Bbelb_020970 [Branchiostoma belcheri]
MSPVVEVDKPVARIFNGLVEKFVRHPPPIELDISTDPHTSSDLETVLRSLPDNKSPVVAARCSTPVRSSEEGVCQTKKRQQACTCPVKLGVFGRVRVCAGNVGHGVCGSVIPPDTPGHPPVARICVQESTELWAGPIYTPPDSVVAQNVRPVETRQDELGTATNDWCPDKTNICSRDYLRLKTIRRRTNVDTCKVRVTYPGVCRDLREPCADVCRPVHGPDT